MNIVAQGIGFDTTAIIREITITETSGFLTELTLDGGRIYIGDIGRGIVTYDDVDAPAIIPCVFIGGSQLVEGDKAQVAIYHFPDGISGDVIAAYTALLSSPQGDGSSSLSAAIKAIEPSVDFELIYRGQLLCTNKTIYQPYAPVRDEYEVIEKDATQYKTR